MDDNHATAPAQKVVLQELFRVADGAGLQGNLSEEGHSFKIYHARNELVRNAAYLRAQARGFIPGHELEDWLAAEHEVDARVFAKIAPVGFVG